MIANKAGTASLYTTAIRYLQQGWEPLPLPPHAKAPVVTGHTGYRGAPVTAEHWNRWAAQGVKITDGPITVYNGPIQDCNLGLRMPPGIAGIDIDHYWTPSRDKRGGDTITALETRLGKLPPTYSSTSRPGTPSKILFYRIPAGVMLVTKLDDVEIIQHHHRYAAIAPSAHPDGRPYLWYDPQDWDLTLDDIPNVDDLAELPWGWVEYLRAHGKTGAADAASTTEVREFIRTHIDNTRPQALRGLGTALRNATGARHDTLVTKACWAMREAAAGWYPAEEAIGLLAGWWADVMDDPDRAGTGGGEFGSAVLWAVGQANADPARVEELRTKAETDNDDWDWVGGTPNNTGDDSPAPPAGDTPFARIKDGADWLLDGGTKPDPLWGQDGTMLAVRHQPTVIAGPPGAGKTVIAGHLMLGIMGVPGRGALLGQPVTPIDGKVLYLASDRPDQARLSLLRMVNPEHVRGRLAVWEGPPPADIVKHTTLLLEMAEACDAQMVVVDSLKDIALRLSDDEVGAAVNMAIQHVIAAGIELIALHHPRKLGGEDSAAKPRRLDDLYGSAWLTAGAGSVLYLHPTGNGHVELEQFKTPNGQEAKMRFRHDPDTGETSMVDNPAHKVMAVIAESGHGGISVMHIARCLCGDGDPDDRTRKQVERAVQHLEENGRVEKVPGVSKGVKGIKYRELTLDGF